MTKSHQLQREGEKYRQTFLAAAGNAVVAQLKHDNGFLKAAKTAGPDDWHTDNKTSTHNRKKKLLQVHHPSTVSDSFWIHKANASRNSPKTLVEQFQCNFIKDFSQKFPQLLAEPNIIWSSSIKHHNIYCPCKCKPTREPKNWSDSRGFDMQINHPVRQTPL